MQEIERIAGIVERMKRRERATQKAKEDIQAILDWVSKQVPDAVTGYETKQKFVIKYHYWDGRNWQLDCGGSANFALKNGKAVVEIWDCVIPAKITEATYLNVKDARVALEEFLENISTMKTFEKEANKITKMKENLRKGGK